MRRGLVFSLFVAIFCCASFWLINASLSPQLPPNQEPPRLYTNQCQQDLRLLFIRALEEAKSSVHLLIFGLSDPAILHYLQNRIKEGIPTTIYYDSKSSPKLYETLKGSKLIPVSHGALMHQKIMIIDEELVFIGSANMTTASLAMHDNLVVGLRSRPIAEFLQKHAPYSSGYLRTAVYGQEVELWLLPDPRGKALSDLRCYLRKAVHSIRIALFTFTHPLLIDELIRAKARGVSVKVVLDLHSALGASAKALERLTQAGIEVRLSQGVQLLHHKFVWIDEHFLLSGSANWTKAAFCNNSDCMIALHQLNQEQKHTMKSLWHVLDKSAKTPRTLPKASY